MMDVVREWNVVLNLLLLLGVKIQCVWKKRKLERKYTRREFFIFLCVCAIVNLQVFIKDLNLSQGF